ncbi:DNA-packaging protein [Kordiimonas sp. SCSIO 12603]|uniref:DNA-packaging protein n=1 Tax=Kordiimonas sp. SCSIO 12603 TaxID=2829596 RepID=UPI0021046C52|nr:terminase family protein [Kordiimonas sp. SCSIO 12603]UTW59969.1 DNA-packaging protein [Kordiimonas sp. SCSIO 12603]
MRFSVSSVRSLSRPKRTEFLKSLTDEEAALLFYDWSFWARRSQLPPKGAWAHWLVLAGRGFGKTRAGAEWVRGLVEIAEAEKDPVRIALVAPTLHDGRAVMIEGDSGLMRICPPWATPKFESSKRTLTWPGGSVATLFSAEEPERLRGPQHHAAWCDELCAWRHQESTWDNLLFGLRLGSNPRSMITTTPKPTALLKALLKADDVAVTRGSTFDNMDNLARSFKSQILKKYEGTRLGRQELMAEVLEDVAGALWQRAHLDTLRVYKAPELDRLVVAIDPPATAGENADECGIVAAGTAGEQAYVLADCSVQGLSPNGWARRAVALYHTLKADRIVIEVNQGGAMAESVIRQVDATVPITAVHATRGKRTRAEPVASLYELSRVHHVGAFPQLEDQMCSFTGAGPGSSPDRLDALVYAISDLMLGHSASPQIRKL